ncbi:MAG: hypothetical protein ACI9U6_003733 [Loktanella salsilacus]|jgi:hypothetical protein
MITQSKRALRPVLLNALAARCRSGVHFLMDGKGRYLGNYSLNGQSLSAIFPRKMGEQRTLK